MIAQHHVRAAGLFIKKSLVFGAVIFSLALSGSKSEAGLIFTLDTSNGLGGPTPYGTVLLQDSAHDGLAAGQVKITFDVSKNYPNGGLVELGLNLKAGVAGLSSGNTTSFNARVAAATMPVGFSSEGSKHLSQFGNFDIVFGNGSNYYATGSILISGLGTLADYNNFVRANSDGDYVAGHLKTNQDSYPNGPTGYVGTSNMPTLVSVPAPPGIILLASGIVCGGVGGLSRNLRRRFSA